MTRFCKQLFFAALLLLTISSCISEIDKATSIAADANKIKTFYATTEGSEPDTKVYADANMKVLWNADDRLSVFNKSTYNYQFRFAGEDGDNAGDFELIEPSGLVSGNDLSNVYAVYPYATTNKINNAGTAITLMLPAEQAYKEHSFGIGANTMIAATNNYFLAFKNVGGYLSLRLYGDNVSVSRITLKGNNHEKIAGKAEIAVGVGTVPSVTMTNEATETISIVCDPAVKLGTSSSNYTDFWFVIPPVTFTKGFTVTVTDNLGGTFVVSTSKSFTISRSTVEWMSPLKVVPNYDNVNVEFADANFKAYCVENFDTNHNGEISIAEANVVAEIDVNTDNIISLKGIEYFPNLQSLACNGTRAWNSSLHEYDIYGKLTSLDLSKNTALTELSCGYNQLISLDVSNNTALTGLSCYSNQLTSLDVSKNTALKNLYCDSNQLTSLDVSKNTALTYLYCGYNQLISLDVSKNTALQSLSCANNQLTSLDVSHNTALEGLWCDSNQLTSLDVSKNTALKNLYCSSNQLTSLDVSKNTALTVLDCQSNQLTSLDVSKNTALIRLLCYSNQLTSLDVTVNTALSRLDCRWNYSPLMILILPGQIIPTFSHDDSAIIVETGDPIPQGNIVFEDANFKAFCVQSFDKNDDGEISFAEALIVTIIRCGSKSIQSLSGIEYFVNLTELSCYSNQLTSLDVSNNTALEYLFCYSNQLTSLDVSNNTALTQLGCFSNQLTNLDVSHNTALTILLCFSNQLTSLDVSNNSKLIRLWCYSNPSLSEIWIKTGQTISDFQYDTNVATIKYKDALGNEIVSIPDANFKAYCVQKFDTNHDGEISATEAQNIQLIKVCTDNIESLKGIEYFPNLQSLTCNGTRTWNSSLQKYDSNGQLTSLDVSKNTALMELNCFGNQLTSLDVSKNTALTELSCGSNQLTSLDVSKNTALADLRCFSNQLTSIDVSKNTALIWLDCGSNQLTSLNVSKNTALTTLACDSNQLASLDVSYNTSLISLGCGSNQLTSLDVSHNTALEGLWCDSNQLTSLDVTKNTALEILHCYSNQLTSLDVTKNTALAVLACNSNQLTSLDVSKNTELTALYCDSNQLTSIDVSKNSMLTTLKCYSNPSLSEIWLKTNQTISVFEYDANVATIKYKD